VYYVEVTSLSETFYSNELTRLCAREDYIHSLSTAHMSSDRVNSPSNRNLQEQKKLSCFEITIVVFPHPVVVCSVILFLSYSLEDVWFVPGFTFKWEGQTKKYRVKLQNVILTFLLLAGYWAVVGLPSAVSEIAEVTRRTLKCSSRHGRVGQGNTAQAGVSTLRHSMVTSVFLSASVMLRLACVLLHTS
jgi:hypothetical protein